MAHGARWLSTRPVQDPEILHVLKRMLKASGKRRVPQGGVLSPLLSNISLTAVDKMLGRVYEVRHTGGCPWGRGGVPDDLGLHDDAQVALPHLGRVARVRVQMGRRASDLGEQSGLAQCCLVLPWGTDCLSKRDPTTEPSTCSPIARLKAPRGEFLAPSTWRVPRRRRSLSPAAPDLGLFSTHLPVESSGNAVTVIVR